MIFFKLKLTKVLCRTFAIMFALICLNLQVFAQQKSKKKASVFAKQNLVAWCIVPFDSVKRGPVARAEMLNNLGITKLAYDWRPEHIPTFDEELQTLKKHNIKLEAFWHWSGNADPSKDKNLAIIFDVLKRNNAKTQLWCAFSGWKDFDQLPQAEKVKLASVSIAYVADKLAEMGCSLGLYNHGGWFGEPENQLQIIEYLKKPNIGIVFNFSHAETQINRFPQFFPKILPYLYSINLTGLKGDNPAEVVLIGEGTIEEKMMGIILHSSYTGSIGIINENVAPDAADGLKIDMEGIKKVLKNLGDKEGLKSYQ